MKDDAPGDSILADMTVIFQVMARIGYPNHREWKRQRSGYSHTINIAGHVAVVGVGARTVLAWTLIVPTFSALDVIQLIIRQRYLLLSLLYSNICCYKHCDNWRHLVWVNGTPLMPNLQDILSPLRLIWPKFRLKMPFLSSTKVDCMEGLWRDDYDALEEWTIFADGHKTRGILSDIFLQ
jgi:hypothetical protein